MSDGLRKVSKLGVADGAPIEAHHVSHIVDTLNGETICDVKFCGSLTIDGSTYNSDTVYSNNFQASTALTIKGSTSNQLIFLDKNGSNNIRFRNAGGTVNRGYMGFSGDDLIINNQQGIGSISIYNINEALTIDTSQNVSIPNGGLTVTTGIITGDGSGLTNLDLTGLDASKLSNLPDSSVWSEDGTTATYTGTAVATNFQGNGSGLTNINGGNVSKVSNAAHADTAGSANSVDGANVNGAVANATNANYATTAGSANSVDGENVNGAVANATYATTAGSAPWDGTLEDSDPKIILNDSTYATIDIPTPFNGQPSPPTTTYTANSWVEWKGKTKTIDRTMSPGGIESYSDYEHKFRMGIDEQGRFRIVRESDWGGCLRINKDSSKIIIDQGLTVSSGGSTITGTSTLNGTTTINSDSDRPLKIHKTTLGSNSNDEVVIAFNTPDDSEKAIVGVDKTSNGGGAKLQEATGWKKIYVKSTGGGINTNFTTDGKLTVSSGGAEISGGITVSSGGISCNGTAVLNNGATVTGDSVFKSNLNVGYTGNGSDSRSISISTQTPKNHIIKSFFRATIDGATKEVRSDDDANLTTSYAKLAVNGVIKADGYYGTSDKRLKTLIGNYNPGEALNTLDKITPKLFKWNELSHASGMTDFGFFAQEVEEVFPFGVVKSKTDNFEDQRSINPIAMVALASAAIKDLSKENNILKDRNRELEDRLKLIEEKLGL